MPKPTRKTKVAPNEPGVPDPQLRQAQKMEALGRLAGGVAHDFNNLLTVIAGYAQMVQARLEPHSPLRSDVEEILRAAARAAALTGQLLTFSRRQSAQPRVLDLNAQVGQTLKMLRRVIGEDIRVETDLAPGIGRIYADPGQIDQVLVNLALNSRDAMPVGGTLTIRTAPSRLRGHPAVTVSVIDTGTGMDTETQNRLFEPFFTTKEDGKGTGLGLSTVYGIVRQNGGEISVESAPGRGTAFHIRFPVTEARVPELAAAPGAHVLRCSSHQQIILLVEDDPVLMQLIKDVLVKQNYRVVEAADGEAALAKAPRQVDLLLTDVVLPGLGGLALASRLKSLQPRVKVLYMTGYAGRPGFSPGDLVLEKPFTLSELTRLVGSVLSTRGDLASAAVRQPPG